MAAAGGMLVLLPATVAPRLTTLPLGVLQTANIEFTSAAFLRLVERIIGVSHNQDSLSLAVYLLLLFACRLGGPLMKQRDSCLHGWRRLAGWLSFSRPRSHRG